MQTKHNEVLFKRNRYLTPHLDSEEYDLQILRLQVRRERPQEMFYNFAQDVQVITFCIYQLSYDVVSLL